MTTEAAPGGLPERSTVFALLLRAWLGALVGAIAVDLWVGWLDSDNRERGDQGVHVRDPVLGVTNRPGFENEQTRINALGLRSDEIPGDAPADEVRVLGVGASQCYGAGGTPQGETWSAHLEELLADDPGAARVRVLNGGVMGYTTAQAARRAVVLLDDVQPDLVIVFVRPGFQSLGAKSQAMDAVLVDGDYVPADVVAGWPEALRSIPAAVHGLMLHSNIYVRHRTNVEAADQGDGSLVKYVVSRAPMPPEIEERIGDTLRELAELQRVADERGVEVRVAVCPEIYQDKDGPWRWYLNRYADQGAPRPGTPRREPTEVLVELVREAGLTAWDMTAEVELIGTDRDRYVHTENQHWSPEGHGVIAGGFAERMRSEGLLAALADARRAAPRDAE